MAYVDMAYIVMAYIATAYTVMVCKVSHETGATYGTFAASWSSVATWAILEYLVVTFVVVSGAQAIVTAVHRILSTFQ